MDRDKIMKYVAKGNRLGEASETEALLAENERLLDLLSRIDQEISAGTSVSVGLGVRQRVDFWHSLCAEIKSTLGEKP